MVGIGSKASKLRVMLEMLQDFQYSLRGDKTFFIAALLAMRHDRLAVFFGSAGALAAMTALSATIGLVLPKLMPRKYTHWAAVALFVYFGLKLLWEALQMLRSGSGCGACEVDLNGHAAVVSCPLIAYCRISRKVVDARTIAPAACLTVPCQTTNINQQMQSDVGQLERALTAALEVVEAQRAQLAAAQEEAARLQLELEREQQARTAAEEKLREASVEFARKLSSMQAKVVEAERDVVLGGQILLTRSAPSSAAAASACSEGSLRVPGETPRRLAPVPPPPRDSEEPGFSRAQCFTHRGPAGPPAAPPGSSGRRTRSAQHRLSPIEPHSLSCCAIVCRPFPRAQKLENSAGAQNSGIFASALVDLTPSEELEEVEQSLKEQSPKAKQTWAVAGQALTLTFLAEWGDRSQISTIALAAAKDPLGVTLGGIIGHSCCTSLAVLGGRVLAEHISERMVVTAGGVLFLCFALHGAIVGSD
ncbi:Transmembrane protein 165 [Symbiodinium microadriaticum]|uniref:Transmembrane protein 165 n=1 Tax=Symbiodinium microadriaticum TaxID=2951 RepID=A0A1Q9DFK5_SYMMI|nr:Transmembrane protein 165 [Symbiodinium microadriaticum]CAE7688277.1 TMEM165 [Symbiodinium microadriaticum]CAE7892652.1 TMEM165 [Symbiodinium sp. KB8]